MNEDEDVDGGGGGGGGTDAPGNDRESRLERRMATLTSAVESLVRNQKALVETSAEDRKAQEARQFEAQIAAHGQQLTAAAANAARAVDQAEAALAKAHEDGDAATIARSQRKLAEAVSARDAARKDLADHRSARQDYEARRAEAEAKAKEKPAEKETGGDADKTNLNRWLARNNSWYGVDDGMTKAALKIDEAIRSAGVIPIGSTEYFEAIDRQMARQFPDRMGAAPDTGRGRPGAPSSGGGGAGRGRIPHSVIDGWRKMGINVDDPATIERMVGHRQTAVRKGLLPQEPAYGAIRT